MRRLITSIIIIFLASMVLWGQGQGTPNTLRVRTDANNSLVASSVAQVNPTTTSIFNSTRLRTDANGNLLVVNTGGASGATTYAASTCVAPGISLTGATTTGFAFTAVPSIINCVNGVNVIEVAQGVMGFGGLGVGNPGLRRSGATLQCILGNESALCNFTAAIVSGTFGSFSSGYQLINTFVSGTAPSIPVACTSPTVTWNNGTAIFQIDVGTTCAAVSTLAFTLPVATNGWLCDSINITTATSYVTQEGAGTTTSVTLRNYARTTGLATVFVDGADIRVKCMAG